jgi:hypothetical protein
MVDGAGVCSKCGLVGEQQLSDNNVDSTIFCTNTPSKRSVYKPVLYGRSILHAVMGMFEPVDNKAFKTLLQKEEVPRLLADLKLMASSLPGYSLKKLCPIKVRRLLKKIERGRYYRYATFLCNCLNPTFKPPIIQPNELELMLFRFRSMASRFRKFKDRFNKRFKTKRKSLPHVPTLLKTVMRKNNLFHLVSFLPSMQSKKRETFVRQMADFLYEDANFLNQ